MQPFILAATPAYNGTVTTQWHRAFLAMSLDCQRRNIRVADMLTTSGVVSRSRNSAAAAVIANPEFTHLLTTDADMSWPIGALPRLLKSDFDVVGCTYPARQFLNPPRWVGGVLQGTPIDDGFGSASHLGCGFLLIKRHVLARMTNVFPERKHVDDANPLPQWDLFPSGFVPDLGPSVITDDIGFCRLAMRAGFTPYADVQTVLTHTGPQTFTLEPLIDYMTQVAKELEQEKAHA